MVSGTFCQRINKKKKDYIVRLLSTNKTTAPHIGLLGVLIIPRFSACQKQTKSLQRETRQNEIAVTMGKPNMAPIWDENISEESKRSQLAQWQ